MKITGCSFAFFFLLCLAGCDLGGSSGCPDGQQCCEVSANGNGMGPWTHVCMDSCPGDSLGSVDSSYCSQSSTSLRKPKGSLVGQHVSLPGNTDRAVLLFTSPSCRFASANDSFHRALYKAAVDAGIPFYVVVARSSDAITFKNRTEFAKAPVLLASELSFHLEGTPTVMLVRSGQIRAAWTGERKTVEQQQDILSRITRVGIIYPR
jgi:hypothetical protein